MTSSKPESKRRWLPRFSLRSLILFVALCTSGYGLWAHWEPWGLSATGSSVDEGGARLLALSPDCLRLAWRATQANSEKNRNPVYVQSIEASTELLKLKDHAAMVSAADFSSDGNRIATGSRDGTVRVWDSNNGTLQLTLTGHESVVTRVRFSRDGKKLITASYDGTARLWDTRTGKSLLILRGHHNYVLDAVLSSDASKAATAGLDMHLRLWNLSSGLETNSKFTVHYVDNLSFSPDDSQLLSRHYGGPATLWELTADTHRSLGEPDEYHSTAMFTPDGNRILLISASSVGKIVDATTGTPLWQFEADPSRGMFSQDGSKLVLLSYGVQYSIWRRRRPEWWWGVAWLPEFSLTLALGVALSWSLIRDRRMI